MGMRRRRGLRLRIALFFFCLPRPRHCHPLPLLAISSVPPPWLLFNVHLPPRFLFLFSYSFHPLSSFQTHPVPQPCSPPSTGTELPSRATPIEIPDRGKFDQILYIHMVKLSLIYSPRKLSSSISFSNASESSLPCVALLQFPGFRPNGNSDTNKRRSKYSHLFPSFDSLLPSGEHSTL